MEEIKKKILVLDDDPCLLELLEEIFNYAGFHPILISKTDDLLSLVRLHQPDLILLDLVLRGDNDGGIWCRKLKSNLEFAQIPVIIFTASTIKEGDLARISCNAFIPKPFDIDDLVDNIKVLVEAE